MYLSLPILDSHCLFISSRTHTKSILGYTKYFFITQNSKMQKSGQRLDFHRFLAFCQIIKNFTPLWFIPLRNPHGTTAVTSTFKVEFFAQVFSKYCTLDSRQIPLTLPYSNWTIDGSMILKHNVLYALSGQNPRKAYGPNRAPPFAFKNRASLMTACLINLLRLILSASTFPSSWEDYFI